MVEVKGEMYDKENCNHVQEEAVETVSGRMIDKLNCYE